MGRPTPWRWRWEILWTRLLTRLAILTSQGEPNPDVHLFLAERYWQLSDYHHLRRNSLKATLLDAKARWRYRQGGGDDLRPAAAASMGIPRRPTFTKAIGKAPRDAA
jgi:hypothetical protein